VSGRAARQEYDCKQGCQRLDCENDTFGRQFSGAQIEHHVALLFPHPDVRSIQLFGCLNQGRLQSTW